MPFIGRVRTTSPAHSKNSSGLALATTKPAEVEVGVVARRAGRGPGGGRASSRVAGRAPCRQAVGQVALVGVTGGDVLADGVDGPGVLLVGPVRRPGAAPWSGAGAGVTASTGVGLVAEPEPDQRQAAGRRGAARQPRVEAGGRLVGDVAERPAAARRSRRAPAAARRRPRRAARRRAPASAAGSSSARPGDEVVEPRPRPAAAGISRRDPAGPSPRSGCWPAASRSSSARRRRAPA